MGGQPYGQRHSQLQGLARKVCALKAGRAAGVVGGMSGSAQQSKRVGVGAGSESRVTQRCH